MHKMYTYVCRTGWVCGVKRRFDEFFSRLLWHRSFSFFLSFRIFFIVQKSFSEVKHVTRKHCALSILSGRSGDQWSVRPSVGRSGGQREKGQRWMLLFFLSSCSFCRGDIFAKRNTTHIFTTAHSFLAHSRSTFMQNQQFFQWWSLHFSFIFHLFPGLTSKVG